MKEMAYAKDGYKICSRCKENKSVDKFSKHRSEKDGLASYCKECKSIYRHDYRIKNTFRINFERDTERTTGLLMTKLCSNCGEYKHCDEFWKCSEEKDGLMSWCSTCSGQRNRDRYQDNIDQERQRGIRRTREKYQIIKEAKEIPCADCGIEYAPHIMDFDHVRGTKKYVISKEGPGLSEENLLAEIAKCDVVCSNCHRERTFRRKSSQ